MNVNDVKIAMEDLVESGVASDKEMINVVGIHGAEPINGFDLIDTDVFAGIYVLDQRGRKAVSSRVVEKLEQQIKVYREALMQIAVGDTWVETPHSIAVRALEELE